MRLATLHHPYSNLQSSGVPMSQRAIHSSSPPTFYPHSIQVSDDARSCAIFKRTATTRPCQLRRTPCTKHTHTHAAGFHFSHAVKTAAQFGYTRTTTRQQQRSQYNLDNRKSGSVSVVVVFILSPLGPHSQKTSAFPTGQPRRRPTADQTKAKSKPDRQRVVDKKSRSARGRLQSENKRRTNQPTKEGKKRKKEKKRRGMSIKKSFPRSHHTRCMRAMRRLKPISTTLLSSSPALS